MRRCYRGAALALGGVLMTSMTSLNSCSLGSLTVYAAEDALTEELKTAFQEDVLTGEENVETDIPAEEHEHYLTEGGSENLMSDDMGEEETEIQETKTSAGEETVTEDSSLAEEKEMPEEPEELVQTAAEPAMVTGSSICLEESEYQVLLKIVEAEAGGEDLAGRMLVANVVINRVKNESFPNTVTEVVYQREGGRAQFSPISDGRISSVSVSQETVDAVQRAMNGEDISAGALYFRSVYSKSSWFDSSLNRVLEHGNHIFYAM